MKKKYGVVLVHSFVGDTVMTMHKEEYDLCRYECEVLFESDSSTEVFDVFVKKYAMRNED